MPKVMDNKEFAKELEKRTREFALSRGQSGQK